MQLSLSLTCCHLLVIHQRKQRSAQIGAKIIRFLSGITLSFYWLMETLHLILLDISKFNNILSVLTANLMLSRQLYKVCQLWVSSTS